MKRKKQYTLIALISILSLTGCGNKANGITLTCTGEKDNSSGIEVQNITTYHFNEEQYATDYSVVTTQKFKDKKVYKEYKSAQKNTIKTNSQEDITYDLKSDDKKLSLVFTMSFKNIDKKATDDEKKTIKAKSILNTYKERNISCTLKGITEKKLK